MSTPTVDRESILRVVRQWPVGEQVALADAILAEARAATQPLVQPKSVPSAALRGSCGRRPASNGGDWPTGYPASVPHAGSRSISPGWSSGHKTLPRPSPATPLRSSISRGIPIAGRGRF